MKFLPKARTENIAVQKLKDEVLIYDLTTNLAVCLNSTAADVFDACNGKQTFGELKAKYNYTDEIIYLALDGLKKENLIESQYVSPFAGMNRRDVIRKVGLASMIALPVISVLVAPQASHAASGSANCVPLNTCRAAGTVVCPPGCTGTYNFIGYQGSTNGSCPGAGTPSSIDCSTAQGATAGIDYKRTS